MKKNNKRHIFFNSAIVFLATFTDKIIFFILNILIARYLNKQYFGEYTTALAFGTFFSTFSNIGVNQTLKRAINLEKDLENEHYSNTIFIKTILSFFVYMLLCMSLFFTNYNQNTIFLCMIFGLVRIGNEYLTTFYAFYEAKNNFFIPSISKIFFGLIFLTSTQVIILYNYNYFFFAYSRFIIVAIFAIGLFISTLNKFKFKLKLNLLKSFMLHSIYFGLSSIIRNLYIRTNILILSFIQGTLYAGIFNIGFLFYSSLFFIPTNFGQVILPFLYSAYKKNDRSSFQFAFNIYAKLLAIISFYFFIVFFIHANEIITLIYGKNYAQSINILKIISFAIPFMFTISATIITSLDLQKFRTIVQAITLIINIIANIVLIYFFKAEGAAITTVMTSILLFIFYNGFLYYRKIIQISGLIKVFTIQSAMSFLIIFLQMKYKFIIKSIALKITSFFQIENSDTTNLVMSLLVSLFFISITYGILSLLFLIRKNEIRIIKEIFTKKNKIKPKKS